MIRTFQVKDRRMCEAIQFNNDNYSEFETIMKGKFYNIKSKKGFGEKDYCYTTDTIEPIFIHDSEYVIFIGAEIVSVISEDEFKERYEILNKLNTLDSALWL